MKPNTRLAAKRIMAEKGLTVKELAARMGLSASTVSKQLGSDEGMKLKTLTRLCRALEVSIADFVIEAYRPARFGQDELRERHRKMLRTTVSHEDVVLTGGTNEN